MASSTPAWAYDFSAVAPSGQTLYYNIVDGHAEVVHPGFSSGYNNYVTGNLVIPASVIYGTYPYPVTSIDYYAFYQCTHLTSVTIPDGVTSIDSGAFAYCTGLTSVNIPSSVTSIGIYAFYECDGLNFVIIPNSVTTIGENAFYNVLHIEYHGSATGSPWGAIYMNGVTDGDFIFSDATKHFLCLYIGTGGNVSIPSTVDTIGVYAFHECYGLTSVTIPNSVTSIGSFAFVLCTGLTSVTIGSGVTSIGSFAFHGCTRLTSVTIPNSVTSIGKRSFCYCSGLTSVTIPNSVTSIGWAAFENCTHLTSVSIGSGVTSIGERAFYNCSSIHDFISKAVYPPTAQSNTFDNVPADCTLTVPCGSVPHYEAAEPWNTRFPQKEEDCNTEGISDVEAAGILVQVENGRITVEGSDEEYVVYDIMGHMVRNESLPAGVYLVKIGTLPARRVVVIR